MKWGKAKNFGFESGVAALKKYWGLKFFCVGGGGGCGRKGLGSSNRSKNV